MTSKNEAQQISVCDLCQQPVSFFCRRCGDNLCDPCALKHLRVKSKNGHDIVDFVSKDDDDDTCHCDYHPQNDCSAFCETCDAPICILCVSIKHKSHEMSELSDKIEEVLKVIARENDRLQSHKQELERIMEHTTKLLFSITSFYKQKKDEVTAKGEEWHKHIENTVTKLHQELDDMQKEHEGVLLKQKKEFEEIIGNVDEINGKALKDRKSKNVKEMRTLIPVMEKQEILSEISQYSFPTFYECKIDTNYLKSYFGYVEKLPEKKIPLLGNKLSEIDFSIKTILEVPMVLSVIDTRVPVAAAAEEEEEEEEEEEPRLYDMAVTDDNIDVPTVASVIQEEEEVAEEVAEEEKEESRLYDMAVTDDNIDVPTVASGIQEEQEEEEESRWYDMAVADDNIDVPTIASVIQEEEEEEFRLYNMAVTDDNKVWIGGARSELKLYDLQGRLHHAVSITCVGLYFCISNNQVVFSDINTVKIISDTDIVDTMFTTGNWEPYGITCVAPGDLLVCLFKDDQSKVVRYSSTGTVLQEIQYDSQCQPLYQYAIYIAENVNGDIIVTDYKKNAVIAVNRLGIFRYSYSGQDSNFEVSSVATDSVGHVIVIDFGGDKIHMLDRDGRFLRYIIPDEGITNPRGVCILGHGDMMVGECLNGIAKRIKYLEE